MRSEHVRRVCWGAAVLFLLFSAGVVADDEKDKADADKKGEEKKSDAGAATEEKKPDADAEKTGPPESDHLNIRSGLRERRNQKQRLAEALQRMEEEKQRRNAAWEADEKRRRDALRRAREELAATRKEDLEKAKAAATEDAPPAIPPEERAIITLQNGNTFNAVILLETDTDIALQIEGGELTIDKNLVKTIRRPPRQPKTEPAKK